MAGRPELLVRPEMPVYDDPAADRAARKTHLAGAFRVLGRLGFENGTAGHAAVRDPERPEWFWTNAFGMPFRRITADALLLVDEDGAVVEGDGIVNRAAYAIHSRVHAARPDVNASVHMHPTAGLAWAALGRELAPITQDACAFYGDHSLFDDYTGVVLDLEEGKRLAHALGGNKAVILSNHGLLTVGQTSVDEAAWWFITMERTCQAQLLAEAAGTPVLIDPDQAQKTAGQVGPSMAGWRAFQPLYEWIVSVQPDLLDE
jgi:ribulose-5-phosphate 4-epimerase/fuculose-1-phosphate aldolase